MLDIDHVCVYHEAVTTTKAMNASLTPEPEAFVRGLGETGRYNFL